MKSAIQAAAKFVGVLCLIALDVSCERKPAPVELRTESLAIIQRLIERGRRRPMHNEFSALRSKTLTGAERAEALNRRQENCADFDRLRITSQVGRPISDYPGIERLGRYIGGDPLRFFLTGLTGYVTERGPGPHRVKIDIDAHSVITRIGAIVASS